MDQNMVGNAGSRTSDVDQAFSHRPFLKITGEFGCITG